MSGPAKRGRPPKAPGQKFSRRLFVPVTPAMEARVQADAEAAGMEVAPYVRWKLGLEKTP